jgi:CubicO group peptidase (beta-lactamase class C family)
MTRDNHYFITTITPIIIILLTTCNRDQNEKFSDKFKAVDSLFAKYDSASPGCAIGIVYHGKLIYKKGYGMADIENQIPNTPDKLFDIASTSKQFTAFCILLLQEQGKLSIEDKIKKYIPELPDCYEPVLIKHLITHTSGIRDHYDLMDLTGIKEVSSEEQNWVNHNYNEDNVFGILIKQKELNFAPGTFYQYCNSGFYLAGKIIERISGLSLREFYKRNIFTPLGMNNTFLYNDSSFYNKNRTMGYSKVNHGYKRNLIKYETYGDGQIMTNIYDMYLWDKNFYNNKLGQGNSEIITQAYTRGQLNSGQSVDYSIGGLEVSKYNGLTVIDRMGGTRGICSDIVRFPDQEFTVICLSNFDDLDPDPWRAALKIADIFLGGYYQNITETSTANEPSNREITLLKANVDKIVGTYFNDQSKDFLKITLKDGNLYLNSKKLIPIDSTCFKIENWSVKINFSQISIDSTKLYWQEFTFPDKEYIKRDIVKYDRNSLEKYTGNYNCSELGLNCQIKLKNDQLFLSDPYDNESVLEPLFRDTFKTSYRGKEIIVQFNLDVNNKKVEMSMNTDLLKNLGFYKQ